MQAARPPGQQKCGPRTECEQPKCEDEDVEELRFANAMFWVCFSNVVSALAKQMILHHEDQMVLEARHSREDPDTFEDLQEMSSSSSSSSSSSYT